MAVRHQMQLTCLSNGRRGAAVAEGAACAAGSRCVATALPARSTPCPGRRSRGLAVQVAAVAAPPDQDRLTKTVSSTAHSAPELVVLSATRPRAAARGAQHASAEDHMPAAQPPPQLHRGVGGRPWTAMHARLQSHLRATGLLAGVDSLLVAVSGGQDSVALLQLLVDLRHLHGWARLGLVHCDHRWRHDSAANADFVVELATQRLGLAAEDVHVEVAGPGQARCERSAREWRYGVFSRVAAECGYGAVVTAHTSTDRAETMMLNLLRGAGPSGLVALSRDRPLTPPPFSGRAASGPEQQQKPATHGPCSNDAGQSGGGGGSSSSSSNTRDADTPSSACTCSTGSCMCGGRGRSAAHAASLCKPRSWNTAASHGASPARLVRPLLQFTRAETLAFVQQASLPYYHDSTNDLNDHRRNRLRNEVMPQLRAGFNPRLDHALARFMDVLKPEVELVEGVAQLAYSRVCEPEEEGSVAGGMCGGVQPQPQEAARMERARGRRAAGEQQEAVDGGGSAAAAAGQQEALKLPMLRKLPLALQRRVLHAWLARELARRRSLCVAQTGQAGTSPHSATESAGASSKCVEVGFEDVARCLPLVSEAVPQGAVSDQLCGGLVAVVDGERLRLRAARELAGWQRRVQEGRRKAALQRKQQLQKQRGARTRHGRVTLELAGVEAQPEQGPGQGRRSPPAPELQEPTASVGAAAGAVVQGLAARYVWKLHQVRQAMAELEQLERELLERVSLPQNSQAVCDRRGAVGQVPQTLLQELLREHDRLERGSTPSSNGEHGA
ncbi:hypothetical protein HYH02_011553 [Chlamydomonas schloesseri]|uniref:tRNA(Ile)-lysidine synthetase n=1 Tax=Chlamydomonas schloesseri TaxID=2026947 RepID=A0A835W460_9CHLO|nr:hypothetical protein HYH02_011553 [Chlamydomonas schloesseri]|eukprot:KAG2436618.1 hypothetical protein HYH02_011553 [Chlamydomonas schloesseri]